MRRLLLVVVCVALLPTVAVLERLRPTAGRRLLVRGIHVLARVHGLRFVVRGQPVDDTPSVLVANHSSLLDIPALLVARPQARFLAAAGLFRIPLLAGAMRALGTVPIDRQDRRQARAQLDALAGERGAVDTIAVFAEGGISRNGVGPFKAGAFRLAIATERPVLPVAITGTAAALPPGARLRVRPATIVVSFGAPIPTDGLGDDDVERLREHTRTHVVRMLAAG